MSAKAAPIYELTISLNALEHLGINLYSNVPSVLSEIVANAWDADAEVVSVSWDRPAGRIIIADDGMGMTAAEVNDRFLKVGHSRRDAQPGLTPKGRKPMGRKGIGKLSLFSIAGSVIVETAKDGERSAFSMERDAIRAEIEKAGGSGTYRPIPTRVDKIDFQHGTRIILTNLRHRQTVATSRALRKRVARRFSIIGGDHAFEVEIDGTAVTPQDRAYYDKLQYVWTYGDNAEITALATAAELFEARQTLGEAEDISVTGWIGTVQESGQLKDSDADNLNRIAIFVRGKMAQEDILGDFSERGVYASYLIGDLRVEGMDTYDGAGTLKDEDVATSSRQRLVEDDLRYQRLKEFLGAELKHIQNRWRDLRSEAGASKALEIPAVAEWMASLKPAVRTKARKWLGKINRIKMDDVDEARQLIKHAVLGFEFYRLHDNLASLDNISDEALPVALDLFKELDVLEANLYGQIVQQRIAVITALREKVDENALERAIQQYLFNHLWLLDPSWERVEGTETMESRVHRLFADVDASLTEEQRRGRLDIAYRKSAGEHVIVELKRPERVVGRTEMLEQCEKYLAGMQKLLDAAGTPRESVRIVFIIGRPPRDWFGAAKDRTIEMLSAVNTRIVFYDELLNNAEKSYRDYLGKRETIDALGKVMNAIDDYAPTAQALPLAATSLPKPVKI